MLQTKNLVKIYKPKKGVPVRALDNVSLTFPEKGMVFLLGKSGSGKSTLLNILGGLDRYNSGDILVMGKSTRKFRQSHFDSYRNTYVGFIFQEYNILDEFSVGTNIALALQLQGQKPDSARVNAILKEVDLEGYGNRNPNELSGGQKQRVAIARALVKNPKIIMADEPTGALDSGTGRQVLTTLKKLSRDKLVIVVSHDREFAEQYADRIVELADGRVIRDVERLASEDLTEGAVPMYMEDSVSLPEDYVLTQADKDAICDYIQKMIGMGKQPRFSLFGKQNTAFQPTDESRIPANQAGYKLIKSRLPLKYAFKLGASGLKHKKFRLVMTILLSCIALGLFALADTFASYDYVRTAVESLTDPESQVFYATFEKQTKDDKGYYIDFNAMLSKADLERIEEETGLEVFPVYRSEGYSVFNNLPQMKMYHISEYYMMYFSGCICVDEALLETMDAALIAGHLPKTSDEIAISAHMLETFKTFGYVAQQDGNSREITIESAEDILDKTLMFDNGPVKICGVVDTGIKMKRYSSLKDNASTEEDSFVEMIARMALQQELNYARNYSLAGMLMVSEDYLENNAGVGVLREMSYCTTVQIDGGKNVRDAVMDNLEILHAEDLPQVLWLDGENRTELADDEVVITWGFVEQCFPELLDGLYIYDDSVREQLYSKLTNRQITLHISPEEHGYYEYDFSHLAGEHQLKVVGVIPEWGDVRCILPDRFNQTNGGADILQTLSPMPESTAQIRKLVEFSDVEFKTKDGVREVYNLMNPVTFELKNLDEVFLILRQVFVWVGLVFVIFASLLFANFIGTSVSYKKQQIGILRAIGSRGHDVFLIFFAESFMIAMINFVLSFTGTILICALLNNYLKQSTGMLLSILNVGVRQAALLMGVCLLSAFVACYLPVRKIAAKRPIDAIRDR